MTTNLRRLLAQLSIDHSMLRDFITQPMAVIEAAGLTDDERRALLSRDQSQIHMALADGPEQSSPAADTIGTPS